MGVGTTEETFRVPSRMQTHVLRNVMHNNWVITSFMHRCVQCHLSFRNHERFVHNVASAQNTLFSFLVKCSIFTFNLICFG